MKKSYKTTDVIDKPTGKVLYQLHFTKEEWKNVLKNKLNNNNGK